MEGEDLDERAARLRAAKAQIEASIEAWAMEQTTEEDALRTVLEHARRAGVPAARAHFDEHGAIVIEVVLPAGHG